MAVAMAMPAHPHRSASGVSPLFEIPRPAFELDLSCPLTLSTRPNSGPEWPFLAAAHSEPSKATEQDVGRYFRRRYLETLFLPEAISPLKSWLEDMKCLLPSESVARSPEHRKALIKLLRPHLLPLTQLEARHRKNLLPLISRTMADRLSSTSIDATTSMEGSSALAIDEVECLTFSLDLRMNSRKATEGQVQTARAIGGELEKRETLMQIVLLLLLLSLNIHKAEPAKKRKRKSAETAASAIIDDPFAALELLVDRLGVWNAVAELGIDDPDVQDRNEESVVQRMLKAFWRDLMIPHFLPNLLDTCASFHVKVFGHPMPTDLGQAPSTSKKPRKPKITRSRPSTDDSASAQPRRRSDTSLSLPPPPVPRATSRAPSDAGSSTSNSRAALGTGMRRSVSRTSETMPEYKRSRSRSIDPSPAVTATANAHVNYDEFVKQGRKFGRAPSGADLFKGRQVGLLRRTSSVASRKERQGDCQSQNQNGKESQETKYTGLLGRNMSQAFQARRNSQSQITQSSDTLIFATPSKPRLADTIFGPRLVGPTPIREEPSSGERSIAASFIAETPVTSGRTLTDTNHFGDTSFRPSHFVGAMGTPGMDLGTPRIGAAGGSETMDMRVGETPMAIRFGDMPLTGSNGQASGNEDEETDGTYRTEESDSDGDESDDPLAGLMVMTDEEVEEDVDQ